MKCLFYPFWTEPQWFPLEMISSYLNLEMQMPCWPLGRNPAELQVKMEAFHLLEVKPSFRRRKDLWHLPRTKQKYIAKNKDEQKQ